MVEENGNCVAVSQRLDTRIRIADVSDAEILTDFACTMAFETEKKVLDRVKVKRAIIHFI